jgi:hypothetical protein
MNRSILHVDMNNCYASIELLSRPDLAGRPVAVGGDESLRHGIVLAKNEIAKRFGVKTAQTLWQARQLCPDLVILKPHHALYQEIFQSCPPNLWTIHRSGRALRSGRGMAGRNRQPKAVWQRRTNCAANSPARKKRAGAYRIGRRRVQQSLCQAGFRFEKT